MCDELKLCLTDRGGCFWSGGCIVTSSRRCFDSQRCETKGQRRKKNTFNSSNWTQPLDPERDGRRDWESERWGKDKRLWPRQENSAQSNTYVVGQRCSSPGAQTAAACEKGFPPRPHFKFKREGGRKREREREVELRWKEERDGKIWLTSEPVD